MAKTVTEHIRASIMKDLNRVELPDVLTLIRTEWSSKFEEYMRNRMIMGAFRYGRLNTPEKPQFDRIGSALKRLELYRKTGNTEHLVDIANMCLLEFEEGTHPNKHFKSMDDGKHHTKRRK
ncbi:MAG: hypothetical protein KAR42_15155 [candidate division Zixibacteria bacterium]|nr:hypothetical protein [candidate division Zixibacteria bacterium]